MSSADAPSGRRRLSIRVSPDLVEWFERRYPWHGAKQLFVESAFRALKDLDERGVLVSLDDPANVISTLKRF